MSAVADRHPPPATTNIVDLNSSYALSGDFKQGRAPVRLAGNLVPPTCALGFEGGDAAWMRRTPRSNIRTHYRGKVLGVHGEPVSTRPTEFRLKAPMFPRSSSYGWHFSRASDEDTKACFSPLYAWIVFQNVDRDHRPRGSRIDRRHLTSELDTKWNSRRSAEKRREASTQLTRKTASNVGGGYVNSTTSQHATFARANEVRSFQSSANDIDTSVLCGPWIVDS